MALKKQHASFIGVLLTAGILFSSIVPASSASLECPQDVPKAESKLDQCIRELQLQKLQLELERLASLRHFYNRETFWSPVIAGLAVAVALFFSVRTFVAEQQREADRREDEVKALGFALLAEIEASLNHLKNRKKYIKKFYEGGEYVEFDPVITKLPDYKVYSETASNLGLLGRLADADLLGRVVAHYTGLAGQAAVLAKGKHKYDDLMGSLDDRIERADKLCKGLEKAMSEYKLKR